MDTAARRGRRFAAMKRPRPTVRLAAATLPLLLFLAPVPAQAVPARELVTNASSTPTSASPGQAHIALDLRFSGLSSPVLITTAGDGSGRLFIVEQTGRIKIVKNGVVLSKPFLSIGGQVSGGGERGLLGLAFHPRYETNRRLFVYFTDLAGDIVVREYRASLANPDVVDTSTARRIIKIGHPGHSNHNGGMLAFSSGGRLFIGTGDGGGAGDTANNAQRTDVLLGKMLRIDVDGSSGSRHYRIPSGNPYLGRTGRDEIWQRGLRNPWRWSFDRRNGNLWIGDVGQGSWEEIDRAILRSEGPGRGVNWGWHVLEGRHCFQPSSGCSTSGKTMPIVEFDHGNGRCAVTGGYVYRGSAIPTLYGGYVYGDYCSGEIWVITSWASSPATPTRLLDTSLNISSFGESGSGELFVVDHGGGRIYAVVQG
jgi:glucose/arabinose dehydrogenase